MSLSFIPALHFEANKLTPEWCKKVIDYYWAADRCKSLLWDKDIDEIEQYSTGKIRMEPYMKMYKSIKKEFKEKHPNISGNPNADQNMQFPRYPAIVPKYNAAVSLVHQIPFEVTCTAIDSLAFEKKQEDIEFIKNKPILESDLQDLADQMQIGKVDLGPTKYSDVPYSDAPYGFDLTQPEELDVFVNLVYKLGGEAAMEECLHAFQDLKNIKQVKLQEIKDQFKFGVSVNRPFESSMTGLPDFKYVYPGNIFCENSELPDFSDNVARFMPERVTPLELFNVFPNEIRSHEVLKDIINHEKLGYCVCNKLSFQPDGNLGSFKMDLVYCEVKSVDGIGIVSNTKKSSYAYMTDVNDTKATEKIWAQNTYGFWWLKNTKHFFGVHKLGYSTRTRGLESYQNFSTNIYRSQPMSAVELCIDENIKAQVASIKLMYALIMSAPAGKGVDIKYFTGAIADLKESWGENVAEQLMDLFFEKNIFIGSSAEFDDKPNAGNLKPFWEIPGGLKAEINGYFQILQQADLKISQFTGVNDQVTGQGTNPEGLVGIQKLLINGSINSIRYINEAIENQYQKSFSSWAWTIKQSIERGGKTKEAIKRLIGSRQTTLLDRLEEIPLHSMGVKFSIFERVEDEVDLQNEIKRLGQQGIFSLADYYMLSTIPNLKRKFAYSAAREFQFRKRYDAEQQQRIAAQQQAIQMQGENALSVQQAKDEGKIKQEYAKGTVMANLQQLVQQGEMSVAEIEGMIKDKLQDKRNAAQLDKLIKTLQTKSSLEDQQSLTQ